MSLNENSKLNIFNGPMYARVVTTKAFAAIMKIYGQREVWHDDPATIHRTAEAIEDCSAFKSRIPHKQQAPKMADV